MRTSWEAASGISSDQGHCLPAGGEPLRSAQCEGDAVAVDDGGPDLGLISNPQQLIRAELAAVACLGQPGPRQEIIDADGDDD
jgi:hypothetical protein